MGYDVHITRRKHWVDDDGPEITLDEWLGLLKLDLDMRVDGFAEAPVDGSTLRVEALGLAVWTYYSGDGVDGNHTWFYWSRGEIVVKNPDVEILRKMHSIAQSLAAAVQGDDGELYDSGNPGLLRYRQMEPDLIPLARLWPNREHESNWLKGLMCAIGFHRWHTLKVDGSAFDFCRWCSEIRRTAPDRKAR